jgi:hypothetical protein
VIRPQMTPMKEVKREERMNMVDFRSINEVWASRIFRIKKDCKNQDYRFQVIIYVRLDYRKKLKKEFLAWR